MARAIADLKAEVDSLTGEPEVRRYVTLASKVRKNEITLTLEQLPMFQKMAVAVGPQLKAIGKLSLAVKDAETEQKAGQALIDKLVQATQRQQPGVIGLDRLPARRHPGARAAVQPRWQQRVRPESARDQGTPAHGGGVPSCCLPARAANSAGPAKACAPEVK